MFVSRRRVLATTAAAGALAALPPLILPRADARAASPTSTEAGGMMTTVEYGT